MSNEAAAGLARFAEMQGATVSALLRSWIEASLAGRWLELVDMADDSHRGFVVIEP